MAKAKKAAKKHAKKNEKRKSGKKSTGRKAKNKVANKKTPKKPATTKPKKIQYVGLQDKRLKVMAAVKIMPCSAISKDMQGLMYCHTQAEQVYQIYRNEMMDQGLTINMIACKSETVLVLRAADGREEYNSRSTCTFRIRDIESGEYDDIQSTALGNNNVWSDNSSQTVAMKQALLQYFFTAWPQPLDHVEVVRSSLNELPSEEFKKALIKMMPLKYMNAKGAAAALEGFFKAQGI